MDRTQDGKPRRTAARGSYAVGDERRARILDAAVEHFAQWGFHASSLARIAKDVGITQGGLLHHFRSKEDLLISVLQRTDEQGGERLFAREPQSAVETFQTLLGLAAYNADRPGRTKMFNALVGEAGERGHPAHDFFVGRYRMVIEEIGRELRDAVERGEVKPDTDPEALAAEIAAVMDGLQLQWALAPETYDMVGRLRAYFDRLLRSVTVDGAGLPERSGGEEDRPES
ncbi:TetR/AcrR family transcriptional regulator [Streptomyces sp. NBC_01363]|uniref:TetR/AcrR family transcriptional regulator n=1 Tax=Streptomyces sp. NBC_01363 TaxID=2903840 RepID=UPI002250BC9C|nr:TetR/AcrR family transcriptional regulator [Streptomyces sp. NBC_01363]MCX4736626.1 TetR/AcrR family transcriptional regulator [Streptomyces sp. NBC_01363]